MVIINDLRVELGMSIILKATQRNIQSCFFCFFYRNLSMQSLVFGCNINLSLASYHK